MPGPGDAKHVLSDPVLVSIEHDELVRLITRHEQGVGVRSLGLRQVRLPRQQPTRDLDQHRPTGIESPAHLLKRRRRRRGDPSRAQLEMRGDASTQGPG